MKLTYRREKEMLDEFRYIDGDSGDELANSWQAEIAGAGARVDVVFGMRGVKGPHWDCNAHNLDA